MPLKLIARLLFRRRDHSIAQKGPVRPLESLDRAHLLLLTRCLSATNVDEVRGDLWEDALGEPVRHALDRFIADGLVEQASVAEKLAGCHSAVELRAMLKDAGLASKGSKADMARRFEGKRPGEAARKVAGIAALRCSDQGRVLAEAAADEHRKERESAVRAALDALTRGDFATAAEAVVRFESRQVFPRGVSARWDEIEAGSLAEEVREIYEARPAILRGLSNDVMLALRPAAAMMMLWGENRLPQKLDTGTRFSGDVAARMLVFSASAERNLRQMEASGVVKRVGIISAEDSCDECKRLVRRDYRFANLPELPHTACTHIMGCRCCYIPYT